MPNQKKVAIILLNWNGADDTIECLESIFKSTYKNFTVFLVDNNSKDGSLKSITSWLNGDNNVKLNSAFDELISPYAKKPLFYELGVVNQNSFKPLFSISRQSKIKIIPNNKNLGFAKANNQVINYILSNNLDYEFIYLLNNDTVIKEDTITRLVQHMEKEDRQISNSIIYNYYQQDKIDFAGGRLFCWGKASYFNSLPDNNFRDSEFAHGCAMMVRKSVFEKYGTLTEKFFHGEEDFEFSWRISKTPVTISCCCTSIVYHKEGASVDKFIEKKKEKLVLSALNRIIDMKSYFSPFKWSIWKILVLVYYLHLFNKLARVPYFNILPILLKINKISNNNWTVSKKMIDKIIGNS